MHKTLVLFGLGLQLAMLPLLRWPTDNGERLAETNINLFVVTDKEKSHVNSELVVKRNVLNSRTWANVQTMLRHFIVNHFKWQWSSHKSITNPNKQFCFFYLKMTKSPHWSVFPISFRWHALGNLSSTSTWWTGLQPHILSDVRCSPLSIKLRC